MKIHFAPDLPVEFYPDDRLQFRDFAGKLQRALYNTEPPFAYGVLGDWGSGKTSILNLLHNLIINQPQANGKAFIPVRFNAWKYENESNLLYPLLYAVKEEYLQHEFSANQQFLTQFKQVSLTSMLALSDVALRAVTHTFTGEGVTLKDLADLFDKLKSQQNEVEKVLSGWANEVRCLDQAFHQMLEIFARDWIGKYSPGLAVDQVRFVFLVDDLDRCLPATVITILESMKNFLLSPNCLFVLALNPRVVYQGIRMKYAGLVVDGREYLEKILNYSFYVPEPSPEQAQKFASDALAELVDEEDRRKLMREFDDFGIVVRDCNFTNPRKVKRILNHYLFFLDMHETDLDRYLMRTVVRLIILAEYFPTIFQLFVKNPEDARKALRHLGGAEFKVPQFEETFGVDTSSIYSQMRYMKNLFIIDPIEDNRQATLLAHVQAVFQIVHHPVN